MGLAILRERASAEFKLQRGGVVTLRSVTTNDAPFLLALYASTREEELGQAQWGEGQKEQFLSWQFGLQQREYEARFPHAEYDLILIDNRPAGRIWIGRDDEQIRLLDISLLPEFQNRGVGTLLLRQLIDEAAGARKPLRHMVFMLNEGAHRFYERLGFVVIEDLGAYKHMEWRGEFRIADCEFRITGAGSSSNSKFAIRNPKFHLK